MSTLRAGTLRDRITIQRRLSGGGLGHPSSTWEDIATVWANIRFGTGRESIRSGQVASRAECSIRIRWRAGVVADMRVVSAGVVYQIKAVLPGMQRREHIDLVCEVVGDGAR